MNQKKKLEKLNIKTARDVLSIKQQRTPQQGRQYFITYHPVAGIRFPRVKKALERDFAKLGNATFF